MNWINDQFKNHRLFRRLFTVYCCVLAWVTTEWSFGYAYHSSLPGLEVAAVITAVQAPVTLLLGFCAKLYTVSIEKTN